MDHDDRARVMNRTRTVDAATCRWPRACALRTWAGTDAATDFVFSLVQRVPERPQWQALCRDSTTSPPVRPRRVATHNALSEAPPTGSSRSEGW